MNRAGLCGTRSGRASNYSKFISLHSHYSSLAPEVSQKLVGPREIYDAAHSESKVLTLSYNQVLELPQRMKLSNLQGYATPEDLFVVSKIIRRAPSLKDKVLRHQRAQLARQLSHAAAVMGNVPAILYWSEETLRSMNTSAHERTSAMQMLTKLAKEKNGKANYIIANELFSIKQEQKAMKAYRLAGDQGVAEAWTKLGRILRHQGFGNKSEAAFKLGADAGEPNSHFMMSTIVTDEATKLKHLQLAAGGGVLEAAHNAGEIYRRKGDLKLAKEYLELASQGGFQVSQMNLASLLLEEKDYMAAEVWYEKAVKNGGEVAEHAQKLLGAMRASPEYATAKPSGRCSVM